VNRGSGDLLIRPRQQIGAAATSQRRVSPESGQSRPPGGACVPNRGRRHWSRKTWLLRGVGQPGRGRREACAALRSLTGPASPLAESSPEREDPTPLFRHDPTTEARGGAVRSCSCSSSLVGRAPAPPSFAAEESRGGGEKIGHGCQCFSSATY
jgi:hypothetical protein